MEKRDRAVAIVAEVADALAPFGTIPCVPTIEQDDGIWTLTLQLRPLSEYDALLTLQLATAIRRVADVAQMRALAERYGIDASLLEAIIYPALDGGQP